MKWVFKLSASIGVFLGTTILSAEQSIKTYSTAPFIGPEIYEVIRTKEGGARQRGTLYGVRMGYDFIRRYTFYWGVDALWAKGELNGHLHDAHLKSELTDANVESRVGYTLQSKCWRCASLTPYLGIGSFWEKNNYKHPSPMKLHFKNYFSYLPFGFLSQIFITPQFSIGINFKVRFIVEGKQYISHDPKYAKVSLCYEEKLQYRAELPMTYFYCWEMHSLGVSLVPFYEYRRYGHRANYPFDFLETTFNLYGATLKFLYLF